MTEAKQRSFLDRLVGRPSRWVAWAWAALAVFCIASAIVAPSGFHTFMAIAWSILAAVQLGAAYYARRQKRLRRQVSETHESNRSSGEGSAQ